MYVVFPFIIIQLNHQILRKNKSLKQNLFKNLAKEQFQLLNWLIGQIKWITLYLNVLVTVFTG